MERIKWAVEKAEAELIFTIAERACQIAEDAGLEYPKATAVMDITAVHANGCRLKLKEFAEAPDFDFTHDAFGIRRHLNRKTGHLEGCFLPRYADMH